MIFWLLFSFAITIPDAISSWMTGRQILFFGHLTVNLIGGFLWACLTPIILHLSGRFLISGRRWHLHLLVHLFASVACTLAMLGPYAMAAHLLIVESIGNDADQVPFSALLRSFIGTRVLYYWLPLLAHHVMIHVDRSREGQLTTSRMEEQLTASRLEVLKARLQPHFLFNTLNTIGSLVRLDEKQPALDTLSEFSELLRHTLDQDGRRFVTLEEEIAFIQKYLRIEQRRFPDRLSVEYRIDDRTRSARIPSLLLQPIIENAVRHGIGGEKDAGHLMVISRSSAGRLEVEIVDDGPGLPNNWSPDNTKGLGLRGTRERLDQVFPGDYRLSLEDRSPRGLSVVLSIPWQENGGREP